jgi:hypothetical protein
MNASKPRYLSQTVDYLGFLDSKLRDLQGIANLAYELIQNADDVKDDQGRPGASRIAFDVRDDALVVENDGVFRDVDFQRMQNVASGGKREEFGTTGAFGVGFIAVYQVTDHPEVFSSGRHWIIRPEAPDGERIEEHDVPTEGTRFRLPWAFDPHSEVRRKLRLDAIEPGQPPTFLREIGKAMRLAALFLKQLQLLELKRNGQVVRQIARETDGDTIVIQDGRRVLTWTILRGDFGSKAVELRDRHSWIEDKRGAEVLVAMPDELPDSGRLFAVLPSETVLPLPFHINADFYPSSDRKHIIFSQDYQSRWNRAAVRAATGALVDGFDGLPEILGHEGLWQLLEKLDTCRQQVERGEHDSVFASFWKEIAPTLPSRRITFTADGRWVKPDQARLLETEDEIAASSILEDIGVPVVHPDLRPYFGLMRKSEIGTPLLTVPDVVGALREVGLDSDTPLEEAPSCLRSKERWSVLWRALDALLDRRQSRETRQWSEERLKQSAIALDTANVLRQPGDLYRGDLTTRQLFPEVDWLAECGESDAVPSRLVPAFQVRDAIRMLSKKCERNGEEWVQEALDIEAVYVWFESRKGDMLNRPDLMEDLCALPIWPSSSGVAPLTHLYIPGDFDDPLALAGLVDLEALGGRREFLEELGVKVLTFATYVREEVPRVLRENPDLPDDSRRRLLRLLAQKLGEMQGDDELRVRLSRLPLVECDDGSFRPAREVYAASPVVSGLLGEQVHVAAPIEQNADAIRALFDWLGVAQDPRPADVMHRVRQITDVPLREETVALIQAVFAYLVDRWPTWDEDERQRYEGLRQLKWLPGTGGPARWYRPDEVFAIFRAYLFETQAVFLHIPRPLQERAGRSTGLIAFLGINRDPTPELVVRHLLYCSERGEPVNRELYRFLNDNVDNVALSKLRDKPCLLLANEEYVRPDQVYWGEHPFGSFRYQLDPQLRQYSALFDRLGVREKPAPRDAIQVLSEIGEEFHGGLDDQTLAVVMGCWEQLSTALEEEQISSDDLAELQGHPVIPDPIRVLYVPEHMFFEDRAGLKAKFPVLLKRNVIKRPQGAWRAMEAAGVQRLSQAVELRLLECEDPTAHRLLHDRVGNRRQLIARLVESEKASGLDGLEPRALERLEFQKARSLIIQYSLDAFNRYASAEPESVPAQLLPDEDALIVVHTDGRVPWASVARELAYAMKPIGEVGGLAVGIKEVLASDSLEHARRTLDELGYPPLQEKMDVDIGSSGAVDMVTNEPTPDGAVRGIVGDEATERTPMAGAPSEKPAGGKSGVGGKGSDSKRKPQSKLRTYVVHEGYTPKGKPDKESAIDRLRVDEAGVRHVLDYEKSQSREPTEMPHHNEGYDVESRGEQGEVRFIEVKSLSGHWGARNAAGLTRAQYEFAREKGRQFWLYVVERATSDDYRICRIQDPAHKVNQYLFDDGWEAIGDPSEDS